MDTIMARDLLSLVMDIMVMDMVITAMVMDIMDSQFYLSDSLRVLRTHQRQIIKNVPFRG